ncbi:hypothetical protein SLE2022_121040 [Rubroshorea leprosula]
MVCQAASKTRFRALKYENGIAGKPTIVVRVIACFQPMEDCQAEYFRHLLKPDQASSTSWYSFGGMVEANNTCLLPQHSNWKLQRLNFKSAQSEDRHIECLPACINPETQMFPVTIPIPVPAAPGVNPDTCMVSTNVAIPRAAIPGISGSKEQMYEVDGLLQQLPPSTSFCHAEPCLKGKQSIFAFQHNVKDTSNPMHRPLHNGFIIFDRSGNQTRMVYSSVQPLAQQATTAVAELASDGNLHEHWAVKRDPPLKSILQENSGENYESADQSEMHEDTEEINALLYSDEESDYDDYDDEVISTDHSPIATKGKYQMPKRIEDVIEEVVSSDGPYKRQRLLNGGYNISSVMDITCSVKLDASNEYNSDGESGYAIGQNQTLDTPSVFGDKLSRKDKIRMTLKILESIIPGAKVKDPLLVLDEAIDYLKSLKHGMMALGVNHY